MNYKTYYTKEEVLQYVKPEHQEEFEVFGFNCIRDFCETSKGWVASFEDCCPYCVHTIIKAHGTKEDKEKFNLLHNLGNNYTIPLTRKDIALDNRLCRKSKRDKWWKKSGLQRKDLEKILKMFRKHKINVQRIGKHNLYTHLDGVSFYRDNVTPAQYVYLHGIKLPNSLWFLCVSSEEEVVDHIRDLVSNYNKNKGTAHNLPEHYEDLVILEE